MNVSTSEPPVSSSALVQHCRLTREVLDVPMLLQCVAGPAVGGQSVFIGTVRDHDHAGGGKQVVALEYEAHPDAEEHLAAVAGSVAVTPGVRAVAVAHRLGRLEVGAAAVVVAVGAEHRHEAFVASRALIDALKARVPIWKRQWYADGTSDWVGCA